MPDGNPVQSTLRRALFVAGLLLLAFLAGRLVVTAVTRAGEPSEGFVAYYTASYLLMKGSPVEKLYDTNWVIPQVLRHTPGVREIYHANPPTTALLLVPLAGLDHHDARVAWIAFNLLLLPLILLLLIREGRLRGLDAIWGAILFVGFQPLRTGLAFGQVYILMLLLLVVAWIGYRRDRPFLLGASLAALLLLKTAVVLLWPVLIVQRRWRALGIAAGCTLAAVILTLPLIGVEAWRVYAGQLLLLGSRPELAVTAYQSLPGLIWHLLSSDPVWNRHPLLDMPKAALALVILSGAALIGWLLRHCSRAIGSDRAFAAGVLVSIILSPVSIDYHYTLLLAPILIMAASPPIRRSRTLSAAALSGTLLIALPLGHTSPALASGLLALLSYPKLYGAMILLWVVARAEPWNDSTPFTAMESRPEHL